MFSSAARSAVHFARRTVFPTLSKQARFLSVSTMSYTKNFYTESVLLSEKPTKATKAKKSCGKKLEQSQLYPDELEKLNNYDLMEEFDLLMDDDKTPLMDKDLRSGKVESAARKSEAVDKMPSMQEVERAVEPKSVTKKFDAVHNRPPMHEIEKSVQPKNVVRKPEEFEEVIIPDIEEIDVNENDFGERLSDSDSESDTEDHFGGMRDKVFNNFSVNLDDLNITKLGRRNKFFRTEMEKASSQEDGMIFNDEIGGIFALAKMGITPESLFVCSTTLLKYYPADLSKTSLYTIPVEDMKYWAHSVRDPKTAMIALYRVENLRMEECSSEPEMPVTIICDRIWHRVGFAQIINSVYIAQPKLFITSKDCTNPWHGSVMRNSNGHSMLLNHDFGLTWEQIRRKVDKKDRFYVIELYPKRGYDGGGTEIQWESLPSVRLYNHSFWDGNDITLIVLGSHGKRVPEELSQFCIERKASKIDVGITKIPFGMTLFHMVIFEMRRQWLAAENGKAGRNGLKNVKTAKSRVRIVSTLFKT